MATEGKNGVTKRILLIESGLDHRKILHKLRIRFGKGAEVFTASNQPSALVLIDKCPKPFDLLITDRDPTRDLSLLVGRVKETAKKVGQTLRVILYVEEHATYSIAGLDAIVLQPQIDGLVNKAAELLADMPLAA